MLCTTTTTKSAPPTSLVQRARDFMAVDNRLSKLSHFSNMCCFFGLAQSDILALQSFMVVNSATNVMFNFLQQKPLLVPSSYSIIFTLLSSSVVVKIISERYVSLSAEEHEIYEAHFAETFDRPRFKKLMALASDGVQVAEEESTRVLHKDGAANLILLLDGSCSIKFHAPHERAVVKIKPGLVGEVGFSNATGPRGGEGFHAIADIDVTKGSRYVRWSVDALRKAKEEDDQFRRALNVTVGLTLSSKLRTAWLEGAERIEVLERENGQLRQRLTALEAKADDVALRSALQQQPSLG